MFITGLVINSIYSQHILFFYLTFFFTDIGTWGLGGKGALLMDRAQIIKIKEMPKYQDVASQQNKLTFLVWQIAVEFGVSQN